MHPVICIDSHTAGEPTRTVIAGAPPLGEGSFAERRQRFRTHCDRFRSAVICEPRGSDVLVGALLLPASDPACSAGVIFFNNAGTLGMCGHGTIGVIETMHYLGWITPGVHRLQTPVGTVAAELHPGGRITVWNVASYRHRRGVELDVPGLGKVSGDVAWGGNWFFLAPWDGPIGLAGVDRLTDTAWRIRLALAAAGVTGAGGAEIDHVELFGPATAEGAHAKNFVLCPGKAYDRSPCGTGTCAKLACLAAEGALAPGAPWVQEGVVGTTFEASYERAGDQILPRITGRAHVIADLTLLFDDNDPFAHGIRSVPE